MTGINFCVKKIDDGIEHFNGQFFFIVDKVKCNNDKNDEKISIK